MRKIFLACPYSHADAEVVEQRDGVARRSLEYGAATIVTGVRAAEPDEVLPPASFELLTDWIRPDC